MHAALPLAWTWLALSGAAPAPIGVVEPSSPATMQGLSSQVASWVVSEAQAQKRVVVPPDALAKAMGETAYAALQACRGEGSCVAAQAAPLHVSRLVVGTLDRDDQSYLVHLWLLDLTQGGTTLSEIERSVRIATRRFAPELRGTLPGFLKGELPRTGELSLTSSIDDVSVQIDGAPAGHTPLRVSLSPGRHEIEVQKPGYLNGHHWVSVSAGKITSEELKLLKVPSHEGGLAAEPTLLPTEAIASNAPPPAFRVPVGTYVTGGIALGALGAALGVGLNADRIQNRVVASYDPVRRVYGATRAQVLAGRNQAIAADVLFATAGASALTALGFLIFTPPPAVAHSAISADAHGVTLSWGGEF